ncbi:MAG: lipocalin family protein [Verrucomicrobia bacterium]|nr:lipocalin family protein [Cytophagales bacterium]
MKNLKFLLLFLLLITVVAGCKKKPADTLLKKWKISEFSGGAMSADDVNKYKAEGYAEFKKDSYELKFGETETGTWTLSEDGKTLTLKNKEGKSNTFNVETLSPEKVAISGGGASFTFVP